MILLRKYNKQIESLKYLKKPTNKIIPPLILKVGWVNAYTDICQLAP